MYSQSESNTQYDQPATQTQLMDDFPEDEFEGGVEQDQCWGQLISRSVEGPHIDLQTIPPDEQGRFNLHLLGRSNQCILQLTSSPRISNKHCIIYCKQNIADPNNPRLEAWIEDLSANGTYINGETRLTKNVPRLLHHRDEIFLVNPEFKRMAKVGTKILEDISQNSFVVMLNLPSPVDEFIQASRDYDLQLSQNENSSQSQNKIERTSTVNRLLGQNRCIYDHYEIKTLLGEGTSGSVYHGINKETGKDWAVKIIPIKNLNLLTNLQQNNNKGNKNIKILENELTKEAEMLRSLRHTNIIHLEDIFSDTKRLFLVMEISSGGDLFDRIIKKKNYLEMEAKIVINQILQAIFYLHERNIAHRDIKPENILLISKHSDVHIKLTDFGLAKKLDESGRMKTFCGTPQYFAPEVLQRRNTTKGNGTYSLAADMWSIGVIMFVLLEGNYPFNENNLSQQIAAAQYSFAAPVWRGVSDEAKGLIRSLLVTDPAVRLTAKQALDHVWFTTMPATTTTGTAAGNGSSSSAQAAVPGSTSDKAAVDMGETAMQVTSTTASTDSNTDAAAKCDTTAAAVRSETVNTSVTDSTVVAMVHPPTNSTAAADRTGIQTASASADSADSTLAVAATSCMSVSSSMQAGMERVNLDPTPTTNPAVLPSPSTSKTTGRGKRSTVTATVATAVTPSTGKRKLIANTHTNPTSSPVRNSGQKAKQSKTTHTSPNSTSKEALVMENYFLKQSPAVITRRVTRSSSSTLNHKN